jgi:hypothetical protein
MERAKGWIDTVLRHPCTCPRVECRDCRTGIYAGLPPDAKNKPAKKAPSVSTAATAVAAVAKPPGYITTDNPLDDCYCRKHTPDRFPWAGQSSC